ncbi:Terpene synthase [Quillaja saponaria]|uniref:ent-kaurene synthase n=1 Tax=Quillaja saponaria TaxID=32244 RepID=A0AAD7LUP5_QUISA|nr:Terpene synthase [Quillaja saponaria]
MMLLKSTCKIKPLSEHNTKDITKAPKDVNLKLQRNGRAQEVYNFQGTITKIRDMLNRVELSVSPYDTAWVAMAPSWDSPKKPCFPQCLNWVMENQQPDGSWGLNPSHPLLVKDSISSTLACLLTVHKWHAGELVINKGLDFIRSNSWAIANEHQFFPVGFDIIFPGLIEYAKELDLNLPLSSSLVDGIIHNRDLEVERALKIGSKRTKCNLAYLSEGLTLNRLIDWKDVMKYQRSNGSLFNSPSTTAAALIHHRDDKCFMYLQNLLERYGKAVPTIFPFNIHTRLSIVETLERLGLDRYFTTEIKDILDAIYRCWLQESEEIFLDITCTAIGFRLLRMHGYEISSDALSEFNTQDQCFNFGSANVIDTETILELYRASQISILQREPILENIYAWTSAFLKQATINGECHSKLHKEVEYALKFPYASLDRLESRKSIELFEPEKVRLLKSSFRCVNTNSGEILALSVQDFNACQATHQKELEQLKLWVKDYKLDKIEYARHKVSYACFSVASIIFSVEYSEARISWAKNTVLTTVVDDFCDVGASSEEILNLVELVEKWDEHSVVGFASQQVKIIFTAIYDTVNEQAAKAYTLQERSIKNHFIEIWLDLLQSMLREAKWTEDKSIPSLEDYMITSHISLALGPVVLIALYFLGSKLSDEVVKSTEYYNLFWHMNVTGRLLNDLAGVKREGAQGKLNSVSLGMIHGNGAITEEECVRETRKLIDSHRKELLRLVLQTEGSVVPQVCKDVFWKTSKILHLFYMDGDGFSSTSAMADAMNAVLNEPITRPHKVANRNKITFERYK